MQRASKLQYSDMKGFPTPSGIQVIKIDKNSWLPSDDTCPVGYYIAFLDGTAPTGTCSHMGESPQTLMQGLFSNGAPTPSGSQPPAQPPPPETPDNGQQKKKTFSRRSSAAATNRHSPPRRLSNCGPSKD